MTLGSLFIFLAAVLWGIDGILRRSLYSLPPITIVLFEHLIGFIILLPFFIRLIKKEKRLTQKEWGAIFWVSLLSGVLGTLWFTTALLSINFIPFSVVYLIQKLQPLFAISSARILLKEKLQSGYVMWAAVALVSAYFVTFPKGVVNLSTGSGTVIAALYALGAAFAWGSTTAFSRYVLKNHSQTFVTGLRFALTSIIAIPFVIVMGAVSTLSKVSLSQFGTFIIIALSTGMVALWIYYRGLKTTQVKVATLLELAFPLTAVLIDFFVYHTVLTVTQYLAAAVLLFAMVKVGENSSKKN